MTVAPPFRAVTFDALGTLLEFEDPAPRLRASLRTRLALDLPVEECARGMAAETRHYRAECGRVRDAATLAALRLECAAVLGEALGLDVDARRLLPCLLESIAFSLYDDVVPALDRLRDLDVRLAIVSNWDLSLHAALAALGVADRFAHVVTSGEFGAAKPDPAIFAAAAAALDTPPHATLHVGDDPETDADGAHGAGLGAVLLWRADGPAPRWPAIAGLDELAALLPAPRPVAGHREVAP